MKDKLTIEYVIENKYTPINCVQYYFPEYNYKLCDFILWEKTCFPMSMVQTLNQLYELYKNRNNENK